MAMSLPERKCCPVVEREIEGATELGLFIFPIYSISNRELATELRIEFPNQLIDLGQL